jgi:hypothetical protein
MKTYSLELWLVAAAILAFIIASHWWAYRVGARRTRRNRRPPQAQPPQPPRRRHDGFDEPIPVPAPSRRDVTFDFH